MSEPCLSDTDTIDLSIDSGALRADLRISKEPGNALQASGAGALVRSGRQPLLRIANTTSPAIGAGAGEQAITMPTVRFDPSNMAPGGVFAVVTSGIYDVSLLVSWLATLAGTYRLAAIHGSPNVIAQMEWINDFAVTTTFSTTWVQNSWQGLMFLKAGETLTFTAQHDAGIGTSLLAYEDAGVEFSANLLVEV